MRNSLLTAMVSMFLFSGVVLAQEAKKDGWWIKASAQKQGSMIGLYVGSSRGSYGFWRVVNPEDPLEFDVPDEYRNSPTLYILAQTTSGFECQFCVMHKDKGIKHFEFDLEEDHEMKSSDQDDKCK